MKELDKEQRRRYSRNIMLEEIGTEGQQKLLESSALLIGAGALGSIAAMYLAGSGVGRIGIADFDTVDISNLQRQLSFSESDCGSKKVMALTERLQAINKDVKVDTLDLFLSRKKLDEIIADYDLVIEGSDNPDTKYMVAESCEQHSVAYCLGGVNQFTGQVLSWKPGCYGYKDIFADKGEGGGFLPCSLGGVIGPLPGIIGSIQATEAIKILLGVGEPLFNRLLIVDALNMHTTTLSF